jgi:hypothetical protein
MAIMVNEDKLRNLISDILEKCVCGGAIVDCDEEADRIIEECRKNP